MLYNFCCAETSTYSPICNVYKRYDILFYGYKTFYKLHLRMYTKAQSRNFHNICSVITNLYYNNLATRHRYHFI